MTVSPTANGVMAATRKCNTPNTCTSSKNLSACVLVRVLVAVCRPADRCR